MINVVNRVPYLRTSRNYPEDLHQLTVEVNKSYVDIATAVNFRTIGIFPTNTPAISGETWYIGSNQKHQSLRQVYNFSSAGSIPHGIDTEDITTFSRIYGVFTDGTNWYPLPYVDVISATNQINVIVNSTDIVITAGGGAPPSISSGIVILEWIAPV